MNEVVVTVKTLDGIQRAVNKLAKKLNAPEDLLPTYGYSIDFGHPHIEVNKHGLHWVVIERGKEYKRKTTNDPHELLYWIFETVTSQMASKFGAENDVESQDFRRIYFRKQEELLGELDYSWAERARKEHEEILREHPFDDYASIRATLSKNLRDRGHSPEEAWRMSCDKYPLPLVPNAEPRG